ncbi:MAG: AAA family ATPase [Acidobacteriota bacterium]
MSRGEKPLSGPEDLVLQRLELENFRGFEEPQEIALDAPVVLFQGSNGCGKSTCLSAIELALTGRVNDLEAFGKGYPRYFVHRGKEEGRVELETRYGVGSARLSLEGSGLRAHRAVLKGDQASFYRERCYLSQVQLGRLLEIYQGSAEGGAPLVQFLQELLQLDHLGALIDGLATSRNKNILRGRGGSPDYRELSRIHRRLSERREQVHKAELKAVEKLEEVRKQAAAVATPLATAAMLPLALLGPAGLVLPVALTAGAITSAKAVAEKLSSEESPPEGDDSGAGGGKETAPDAVDSIAEAAAVGAAITAEDFGAQIKERQEALEKIEEQLVAEEEELQRTWRRVERLRGRWEAVIGLEDSAAQVFVEASSKFSGDSFARDFEAGLAQTEAALRQALGEKAFAEEFESSADASAGLLRRTLALDWLLQHTLGRVSDLRHKAQWRGIQEGLLEGYLRSLQEERDRLNEERLERQEEFRIRDLMVELRSLLTKRDSSGADRRALEVHLQKEIERLEKSMPVSPDLGSLRQRRVDLESQILEVEERLVLLRQPRTEEEERLREHEFQLLRARADFPSPQRWSRATLSRFLLDTWARGMESPTEAESPAPGGEKWSPEGLLAEVSQLWRSLESEGSSAESEDSGRGAERTQEEISRDQEARVSLPRFRGIRRDDAEGEQGLGTEPSAAEARSASPEPVLRRMEKRAEELSKGRSEVQEAKKQLATVRGLWRQLANRQDQVDRLRSQREHLDRQLAENQRRQDRADAVVGVARGVRRGALRALEAVLTQSIDQKLNGLWQSLFRRLAPDERFVPQLARSKARGGGLQLDFRTLDGRETFAPPGAVLSSGTLNTAALSLFLALHLVERRTLPLLVLDDPVQNMDDLRITELAAVLRRLVHQRQLQLVVAVHDPALFDFLSLELGPAAPGQSLLAHRIHRPSSGAAPQIETTRYGWKEEARGAGR